MKSVLFFKVALFPLLFTLLSIQQAHAQKDSLLLKIYFSEGKFGLSPAAKTLLKNFAVENKNQSHINIAGRGDRHGSDALNDSLSLKRALAVKNFLMANGFARENIHAIIGYGRRNPVDRAQPYVDAENRVVWITVYAKEDTTKKIKTVIVYRDSLPPNPAVKTVSIRDTLIQLLPPFPSAYLVGNRKPLKGDTLHIDTTMWQVKTTLFITRKIYVANDTTRVSFAKGVKEIPEKTKGSAIAGAFMDSLQHSVAGQAIIIRGLNFEFGYHVMPTTDLPALKAVLAAFTAFPNLQLEIRGHVCCGDLGQDVFDKQTGQYDLSANRAKEVYDFLIAAGVSKTRLSYTGYGMKQPLVYPEKSKNDQYQNRRIEFMILAK